VNGLLAGLAGVLYASRFNSVGATTGTGLELDVVAAAVVGGVAIFGGSGSVVGAAIGALLLTTITSALTALRVDKFWQQAIVGVLILAAIIIDRVASIRTARRLRLSEARDV
jgi:rhamnose transport system permease protein